jgi:hypothetical protein
MMANPNLEQLVVVAKKLTPLLGEVVFVGGCATGLLVTDPGAGTVRTTYDVDVIAEITSYLDYMKFSERLRKTGFVEDSSEGAPVCRWTSGNAILDVMPLDETILGFSNRWYKAAMESAQQFQLTAELTIRLVTAPYFVATKLEAFKGRGKNDYFSSHDLEDLIAVVDGRPALTDEIRASTDELCIYIAEAFTELLQRSRFLDALPGFLLPDAASQSRLTKLLEILRAISQTSPARRSQSMTWEQIGPKLREFSNKVSVIKVPPEIEKRISELVQELEQLLSDPRNRPA